MKSLEKRNHHTTQMDVLQPGTKARMQHHLTGKWKKIVTISMVLDDELSYVMTTTAGRELVRGRRFFRPLEEFLRRETSTKGSSFKYKSTMKHSKAFRTTTSKSKEYQETKLNVNKLALTLSLSHDPATPLPINAGEIRGAKHQQQGGYELANHNQTIFRVSHPRTSQRYTGDGAPSTDGSDSGTDRSQVGRKISQKAQGGSQHHQRPKQKGHGAQYHTLQHVFKAKRGRGQGGIYRRRAPYDCKRQGAFKPDNLKPARNQIATGD